MRTAKNIFAGLLALIAAAAVFLCMYITISEDSILPELFGTGAYIVDTDEYGSLLPKGSAAFTKKADAYEKGDIVVYSGDEAVNTGIVTGEENGQLVVSSEGEAVSLYAGRIEGRVFYRISGLGSAAAAVREHRTVIWTAAAVLAAAAAVWGATYPSRRRKAEVKELIELFDYYGRKFDAEEEGIDY